MTRRYVTVSIFLIGTEITRGIIADTHGPLLARELSILGYHINRIVIIPDDGSIEPMLRQALQDSDIILLTGGLGPTSDDITRHVVAKLAGVPLVQDEGAFAELYTRIGSRIYGANQRQVCFPEGFTVISNPKGTAPGFWGEIVTSPESRSVLCYAMPGPPVEMHEMFYHRILPELAQLAGHDDTEVTEFSCFLTPESKLEEVCGECAMGGIQWGTRVQEHRISLYLHGGTQESRGFMAQEIGKQLGFGLLVTGDVEGVDLLSNLLVQQKFKMVCAESCTGGLVSKLMTDLDGSSAWFWGGVVSYANQAKETLLEVSSSTIETCGAVSEESVLEMAQGLLRLAQVDFSVSVSGIAGSGGGTKEKPVGTVWFGFASPTIPAIAVKLNFSSYGRASVRRRAALAAILLSYFYLKGADLLDIVSTWQYI